MRRQKKKTKAFYKKAGSKITVDIKVIPKQKVRIRDSGKRYR